MNTEILTIADTVAREKGIGRDFVLNAMEEAVQKIGRVTYGQDNDIRAEINRKTGEITLARYREVVDVVENPLIQVSLEEAHTHDSTLAVGGFVVEPLPPVEFGRMAAQTARQVISQRVREAERERQYEEFKNRLGDIVSGVVKRVEFGNYIIDVNRNETLLRREEAIPREVLKVGDRVRAYVMDVNKDAKGPQVILSRCHPQFMAKLFQQEVPEIYDGVIEILSVARDPGSRAKIAVRSKDSSIDPVGSCVGIRGSRVQAVVGELQGEKVDIVPYVENVPTFVISALAPAQISKVIYDEDKGRVEVVVPEDQLSLAIGRRGQNVRLASLLCGLDISIVSESVESERRTQDFNRRVALFVEALDVDEVIGHLLSAEGFETVQDILDARDSDMLRIEGFDEEIIAELKNRASTFLANQNEEIKNKLKTLKLDPSLLDFPGIDLAAKTALGEKGILTLDDLADLSIDELQDLLPSTASFSRDDLERIIMDARAHWFEDEK